MPIGTWSVFFYVGGELVGFFMKGVFCPLPINGILSLLLPISRMGLLRL